ncbi:hypothetical protein ACIQ9J_21870 [Streptomyces sp. NPDC094153]|uniref:hypothetical protein n=1 Tax=Streptomyces sp. NPDC094153 TaxID=3366058 RepID=UPI0038057B8F
MLRDVRLQIITETIEGLIPGSIPAFLSVKVTEAFPLDTRSRGNSWNGTVAALAERIFTALYGCPRYTPEVSPLAQAEDAKRARDLVGEVGILMSAGADLESAPWHPVRPGDLVHVHYEAAGEMAAFGETYIVGPEDGGLMGMQLLAHTLPATTDGIEGMAGCFAVDAADDPIFALWFEAGPHRLTIVRDGQVVHDGQLASLNGRKVSAAGLRTAAVALTSAIHEAERYLERGEPELALARLRSDKPLPPCGAPGFTPEQPACPRPRGHRPPCSDSADYVSPPHECAALPEQLFAVLSVGPKRTTISFEGLYADKEAALDVASGWDQRAEAERRGGQGVPDYVFVDLPVPGGPSLAVVAPMPVMPDPAAEEEWAAEGMATALGPEDYADDYRDVDE